MALVSVFILLDLVIGMLRSVYNVNTIIDTIDYVHLRILCPPLGKMIKNT